MKNLYHYILISILISTAYSSNAQDSYFFNQKNLFSIHASYNPRLIPKSNDKEDYPGNIGIKKGTYYQYYNDKNVLVRDQQKSNLMLNTSYGRLFGGHSIFGIEFNYQKQNLTVNKNANLGPDYDGDYTIKPFLASTPVYNVFDIQLTYGYFESSNIAPNKHIFSFGAGVRIFSLDQNQNYRKDADTPFTNLSTFIGSYDENIVFLRLSMNYTYRILITKNVSIDLGINTNVSVSGGLDATLGIPNEVYYDYQSESGPMYSKEFIDSKLGHETFFNIFYFRAGLSFAI